MKSLGVDLAGKSKNTTGMCLIEFSEGKITKTETWTRKEDLDILVDAAKHEPDIIAVDAPFSFPAPDRGYYRDSDDKLMDIGLKPLSPIFPGMKPLVERAMRLVPILRDKGFNVVESYPKATEKILGLGMSEGKDKDEYEAMLCALTGKLMLEGRTEELGEEKIVIPTQ